MWPISFPYFNTGVNFERYLKNFICLKPTCKNSSKLPEVLKKIREIAHGNKIDEVECLSLEETGIDEKNYGKGFWNLG